MKIKLKDREFLAVALAAFALYHYWYYVPWVPCVFSLHFHTCTARADDEKLRDVDKAFQRRDVSEAVSLLRSLAKRGNAAGEFALSVYLLGGDSRGRPEHIGRIESFEAKDLLIDAAEKGNADAQHGVGTFYEKGWRVNQDDAEAYFWFSLAVLDTPKNDNADYSKDRDAAAARLSPQQKAAVDKRVEEWLKDHPPPTAVPKNAQMANPGTKVNDNPFDTPENRAIMQKKY